MNRGADSQKSKQRGYTIVETLIFLAVSGLMLTTAMLYISGRQARQQFQTSVREFETNLTSIANDVATGYYQTATPLECEKVGSPARPRISAGSSDTLGKNTDCIFVGTVVKLGEGGGAGVERLVQLTMAGLRLNSSGTGVTTLAEANPRAVNIAGGRITSSLGTAAVQCVWVGSVTSVCPNDNAAIGFFSTFDGADPGAEQGGTIRTNVITYPTVTRNDNTGTAINKINGFSYTDVTPVNQEITICLSGGNQHAFVKLGGSSSSSLTVTSEIRQGSSCV